jgi:hypothetical protein
MSKFDELCRAYGESRNHYFHYKDQCIAFATRLASRFIERLGVPEECIKYIHLDGYEQGYTPLHIALRNNDDATWDFGIVLTVRERPGAFPIQPFLYTISFKKLKSNFEVKLIGNDTVFLIDSDSDRELDKFIDKMYKSTFEYLTLDFSKFLEGQEEDAIKRIGF